jgi:hypothetical protein
LCCKLECNTAAGDPAVWWNGLCLEQFSHMPPLHTCWRGVQPYLGISKLQLHACCNLQDSSFQGLVLGARNADAREQISEKGCEAGGVFKDE